VLTRLSMTPISLGVSIPHIKRHVADGSFTPAPGQQDAVAGMLDELQWWAGVMRSLRANPAAGPGGL